MRISIRTFQKTVWRHYRRHGRHDMVWRKNITPYRVVVSEVMLQQTQVARVTHKLRPFVRMFPSFRSLARAPLSRVLAAWQGLGYNRRALMLKRLAQTVVREHGGILPRDPVMLAALPGIGFATAGSIAAFAFQEPVAFIETNIRRVFIHFFFPHKKSVHDSDILKIVQKTVDTKNPREWYFALMDYGAWLARAEKENPNRKSAHYQRQPKFEGSDRQVRGRILALLVTDGPLALSVIARRLSEPRARVMKVAVTLAKERLATIMKGKMRIAM
ncbi:MAG: A/G-specific adenine glycosylase [Patescibacteria group bacterium]